MKNKKLILLSMIIISIFTIKNTNASVKSAWYSSNFTYDGFSATSKVNNSLYNRVDITPNNNNKRSIINVNVTSDLYVPKYANYFTIPFSITDLTNKSNKLTCTGFQTTQTTYNFAFQTTYTDGTTSQNDGVINEGISHPTFCNEWQVASLNDYSINVNYALTDNYYMNCQIVNTGESYNVICPIDRSKATGSLRVKNLEFIFTRKETDNNTNLRFLLGEMFTFDIDEEFQILDKLNDIYETLNQSKTIQQQIQNNTNEIKNKMNEDISEEDKEQPNTANFESSKQQEENIKNSISNANPNDITFNTDLTATSKIWEIVTNFLNTNSKVMGLMISILSLGVIKMILNR